MVCIYCGGTLSVKNSRSQQLRNQTWRRRQCEACLAIFTSTEHIELRSAVSVKQITGELQAFSYHKLFVSIYESCRHRAHAADDAGNLTDTIISQVLKKLASGLLHVEDIIDTSIDVLERFDKAAAVQYAAFHSKTN